VRPVESGSRTLKDAVNEAIRDRVTNITDTSPRFSIGDRGQGAPMGF
jgi:tryptophan synthase beta subunit